MFTGVMTPPLESTHRTLFERAVRHGEEDLVRLVSVGAQIERAGQHLDAHSLDITSPHELVQTYEDSFKAPLDEYISDQLELLTTSRTDTQRSQHRVRLLGMLSDQIILLPRLFNYRTQEASSERARLIDDHGIYGAIAMAMEATFEDHITTRRIYRQDRDHTIGLLSEQSALALLDRPQASGFAAVPTLPAEDINQKIDIRVYMNAKHPETRNLQIKTGEQNIAAFHQPMSGILLVSGRSLGNSFRSQQWPNYRQELQTCQAILRDTDGSISDADAAILEKISTDLITAVKSRRSFIGRIAGRSAS